MILKIILILALLLSFIVALDSGKSKYSAAVVYVATLAFTAVLMIKGYF